MRWIFVLFVVVGTTLAQLECPGCAPTTYTVDDLNCDFDPVPLEKFVEPLPDLQLIRGEWNPTMNYPLYKLNMAAGFHKLHPSLPETKMWMYNGIFPGPLFDIESWQKVHIEISNNLPIDNGTNPESPLLPINDPNTRPADRTVVHLHGSVSKPQYCGHPMDWVRPLPGKNVYVNYHANQQSAGTLWYHDHAQGITAPNVYTGLSGIYLLRDEHERSLDLPRKEYEIVLHIADRDVDLETGQLKFDENRGHTTDPFQVVNGKIWPYRDVEPGRYRFRILNASNHRFYNFTFSNNMDFWQIGVDQGFLERAVKVKYLFLGSAERADIIVDFKEAAETKVELLNTAGRQVFPVFSPPSQLCSDGTVMQFRVGKTAKNSANHGKIPTKKMFDYQDNYPDLEDARVRKINLKLDFSTFQFLINDTPFRGRPDPVIPLGDTEVWEFINAVPSSHPMHVHMVGFYVVDRQPFNATLFAQNQLGDNNVVYTGPARKPPPTERGVKDVAVIFPNEVLRIAATFGPYPGEFVYHCHLLEHEDNDMMRRFAVGPVGPDCQWDADQTDEDCSYYD